MLNPLGCRSHYLDGRTVRVLFGTQQAFFIANLLCNLTVLRNLLDGASISILIRCLRKSLYSESQSFRHS